MRGYRYLLVVAMLWLQVTAGAVEPNLFLGLRKAGTASEPVLNLGRISGFFPDNLDAFPLPVASVGEVFGTMDSVGFAFFASTGTNSGPGQTAWISRPRAVPTDPAVPWDAVDAGGLAGLSLELAAIAGPDGYSAHVGRGDFNGTFQGIAENVTPPDFASNGSMMRSDLYAIHAGGEVEWLGYFDVFPDGRITFMKRPRPQWISFPQPGDVTIPHDLFDLVCFWVPPSSAGLHVSLDVVSGPGASFPSPDIDFIHVFDTGTVTVTARQDGGWTTGGHEWYSPATPVTRSFQVTREKNAISFGPLPDVPMSPGGTVRLVAGDLFAAPIAFSLLGGPATLSGDLLTLTGTGVVTVVASQTEVQWIVERSAAVPVTRSFEVVRGPQAIDFAPLPDVPYVPGATVALGAVASSGLPVTYGLVDGPATIAGNVLVLTGPGTVTVVATQAGDGNYEAAVPVTRSFAGTAPQAIGFPALPDIEFVPGTTVVLAATASSGLPVAYTVTEGPATATGDRLAITGAGTVTVRATQAGGAGYSPATPVSNSFVVAKGRQALEFAQPAGTVFSPGKTLVLAATASSGLPVSYALASGPATIVANVLTITGAGPVDVVASQPGNADYLPAPPVGRAFVVARAPQAITFATLPNFTYSPAARIVLSAVSSCGLPVAYTVESGPATVSGNVVSPTGAGVVTILARQDGNADYEPAEPVPNTFTVTPGSQRIRFAAVPNIPYAPGTTRVLEASASSGLPVSFAVADGPATVSGNVLAVRRPGLVVVVATQPGDADYFPATPVTNRFVVLRGIAAVADALVVGQSRSGSIPAASLLANDRDGDGLPIALAGVGEPGVAGASVAMADGLVTYTPADGFVGTDAFAYMARDDAGNVGSAVVRVLVVPAGSSSDGLLLVPRILADGAAEVRLAGIPGSTHVIQSAPGPDGPWSDMATGVADPYGQIIVVDPATPRPEARVYRAFGP